MISAMAWDESAEHFYASIDQRPRTGLIITTAAATSVAVIAGLHFALPSSSAEHRVPALVGLPLEKAILATRSAGLQVVVSGAAPDALVDRGAVSRQDPLAGSLLAVGGRVAVVISEGTRQARPQRQAEPPQQAEPPRRAEPPPPVGAAAPAKRRGDTGSRRGGVDVPRLKGVSLATARHRLERAGLRAGQIRWSADEDLPHGVVIGQIPEAGERVARGTAVDLVANDTDKL